MSSFDRREERMASDELEPTAHAAGREADPRARLADADLRVLRGPASADDHRLQEKMEEISPDGRPPPQEIKRESRRLFFLGLTVAGVVVLVAIYAWGGIGPTAVALVLWGGFIGLAAWPTWHAALDRKADETRARRQIGREDARVIRDAGPR